VSASRTVPVLVDHNILALVIIVVAVFRTHMSLVDMYNRRPSRMIVVENAD